MDLLKSKYLRIIGTGKEACLLNQKEDPMRKTVIKAFNYLCVKIVLLVQKVWPTLNLSLALVANNVLVCQFLKYLQSLKINPKVLKDF
jgi:hypothetical protein